MAAELEKLARDLAEKGYAAAALHLQKEAVELKQGGLIPDTLPIQGNPEIPPQELAIRAFSLADYLADYPRNIDYFSSAEGKGLSLLSSHQTYPVEERSVTLHSLSGWIPTDLGSGGLAFETNIGSSRRREIRQLGIDTQILLGVGVHTEERSKDRARALVQKNGAYKPMFETSYFIDANGNIAKLSLVPIVLDLRPDVFNAPIHSLGLKRLRADITSEDLRLIDSALYIFETELQLPPHTQI